MKCGAFLLVSFLLFSTNLVECAVTSLPYYTTGSTVNSTATWKSPTFSSALETTQGPYYLYNCVPTNASIPYYVESITLSSSTFMKFIIAFNSNYSSTATVIFARHSVSDGPWSISEITNCSTNDLYALKPNQNGIIEYSNYFVFNGSLITYYIIITGSPERENYGDNEGYFSLNILPPSFSTTSMSGQWLHPTATTPNNCSLTSSSYQKYSNYTFSTSISGLYDLEFLVFNQYNLDSRPTTALYQAGRFPTSGSGALCAPCDGSPMIGMYSPNLSNMVLMQNINLTAGVNYTQVMSEGVTNATSTGHHSAWRRPSLYGTTAGGPKWISPFVPPNSFTTTCEYADTNYTSSYTYFSFVAQQTGIHIFDTAPSNSLYTYDNPTFDAVLFLYCGLVTSTPNCTNFIAASDSGGVSLTVNLTSGQTYSIVVGTADVSDGDFALYAVTSYSLFLTQTQGGSSTDCSSTTVLTSPIKYPSSSPSATPSTSPSPSISVSPSFASSSSTPSPQKDSATRHGNSNTTIGIAVGVSAAGCLLLSLAGFVFYRQNKKKSQANTDKEISMEPQAPPVHAASMYTVLTTPSNPVTAYEISPSYGNKPQNFATSNSLAGFEPGRITGQVIIQEQIGGGNFGEVYKGTWDGTKVALKKILGSPMEMYQEMSILSKLAHPNVVSCFGLYEAPEGQTYIVTEFMNRGSLDKLVTKQSANLTTADLLALTKQAASGMVYLEREKVVHRDLALRNLLVATTGEEQEKFIVKVADFGLSRMSKEGMYQSDSKTIPIRWSALEILFSDNYQYTSKADVWSFGVVLWELFSYGEMPYPGLSNLETLQFLKAGHRMEKPKDCPDEIYDLMLRCWDVDPEKRPTFMVLSEINSLFQKVQHKEVEERIKEVASENSVPTAYNKRSQLSLIKQE